MFVSCVSPAQMSNTLQDAVARDRDRRRNAREADDDFFGEAAHDYIDANRGADAQRKRASRAVRTAADATAAAHARAAHAHRMRELRASQADAADGGAAAREAEAQRRRELRASQADAADGGAAAREAEAQRKRTARLKRTDAQNDAHNARRREAAVAARAEAQLLADGLPLQDVARAAADAMLPDAGVAADGVGAAPAAAAAPANQQHRFLPKNLTPDQIRRIADSSFPCDRDADSIPYIASCLGYLDYKGKFNKPDIKSP